MHACFSKPVIIGFDYGENFELSVNSMIYAFSGNYIGVYSAPFRDMYYKISFVTFSPLQSQENQNICEVPTYHVYVYNFLKLTGPQHRNIAVSFTHWDWGKMASILQIKLCDAFSCTDFSTYIDGLVQERRNYIALAWD